MDLIKESFQRLFPEREILYQTRLEYNRRLRHFNANIRLHHNTLGINLNLEWKSIDPEITIGLIQHLLLKVLKEKKSSPNIELYHQFVKQMHHMAPKTKTDAFLEASFQRVNGQFFSNELEQPNLSWGQESWRKLAAYNYHTDTVVVSSLFQNERLAIIDYLMYHELLHKQQQFQHKNGRSHFHTRAFKEAEQLFPHHKTIEQEIQRIIRKKKYRNGWRSLWGR